MVSEGGVAAGVRRIEAVTGEGAIAHIQTQDALLRELSATLKAQSLDDVAGKIAAMQDGVKPWKRTGPPESQTGRQRRRRTAARRRTSAALSCWPPSWKAPTPLRCAKRWTS